VDHEFCNYACNYKRKEAFKGREEERKGKEEKIKRMKELDY
jgi:hypothetical protein